jgi:hypothetical protein
MGLLRGAVADGGKKPLPPGTVLFEKGLLL